MVGEQGELRNDDQVFKEVRIEYNYDARVEKFRDIAIVRDESLWGEYNCYTLRTPLIKTERRAIKVAEGFLANLNRSASIPETDVVPSEREVIISWDDDKREYERKLKELEGVWRSSPLSTVRR